MQQDTLYFILKFPRGAELGELHHVERLHRSNILQVHDVAPTTRAPVGTRLPRAPVLNI